MNDPKVELISWTPNPIELLFVTEKFAKTDDENPFLTDLHTVADIRQEINLAHHRDIDGIILKDSGGTDDGNLLVPGGEYSIQLLLKAFPNWRDQLAAGKMDATDVWYSYVQLVEEWALKVASMSIPVAEMVSLVFRVNNVSIAWREQLVRHRVGHQFWIQSGRITNNSCVYDNEAYHIPDSVKKDPDAEKLYMDHWSHVQDTYRSLREKGIPDEDCREVLGSGTLHRLTWGTNLRALGGILKHRCCFIAQGHWVPIVQGIISELRDKVDPIFGKLGYPPCWNNDGKFTKCAYEGISEERFEGKDPHSICPIWLGHCDRDKSKMKGHIDKERNKQFGNLWNRKDI